MTASGVFRIRMRVWAVANCAKTGQKEPADASLFSGSAMTDQQAPSGEAFPAATREDWMRLVEGVLKGRDFEQTLVSQTADGIRIDPLYAAALAQAQPVRVEHAPWRVAQRVDHPDPREAAHQALTDLEGGADALSLVFEGHTGRTRFRPAHRHAR